MTIPESWKGRQGALVAAGIAGAGALLIVLLLGFVIFGGQSADTQEAVHQLAIYRAEMAMRPQLEAQLKALKLQAAATPGLIANDNPQLAQAQLQDEVKAIVVANQGEVRMAQVVPASTVDGFQVIAVQYDLMVPMARLRDLTYAIETHTPYLFIDGADIVSTQDLQSGDPQTANPMLEVRWTVHGYRWSGAK
jgi:type II secretion system (T2SS) protein M